MNRIELILSGYYKRQIKPMYGYSNSAIYGLDNQLYIGYRKNLTIYEKIFLIKMHSRPIFETYIGKKISFFHFLNVRHGREHTLIKKIPTILKNFTRGGWERWGLTCDGDILNQEEITELERIYDNDRDYIEIYHDFNTAYDRHNKYI